MAFYGAHWIWCIPWSRAARTIVWKPFEISWRHLRWARVSSVVKSGCPPAYRQPKSGTLPVTPFFLHALHCFTSFTFTDYALLGEISTKWHSPFGFLRQSCLRLPFLPLRKFTIIFLPNKSWKHILHEPWKPQFCNLPLAPYLPTGVLWRRSVGSLQLALRYSDVMRETFGPNTSTYSH